MLYKAGVIKIFAIMIAAYTVCVMGFYYFAGEQLHIRESRGNIVMLPPSMGTVELVVGNSAEQIFTADIQRIESVSVLWGTYYRANEGNVKIELVDLQSGNLLASQILSAAQITEGFISVLKMDNPIEGYYRMPLLLRLSSPDSQLGSAVSPMRSSDTQEDGFALYVNGAKADGTLCFSVSGTDYIWTGQQYWKLAAIGMILLLAYFTRVIYTVRKGKKNLLILTGLAIQKYRFLIKQLVLRDFKGKYKRSVLGMLWSLLNPLLTMVVQYLVFSNLFRFSVPNYPVYLLCGLIMYGFFSEVCGMALVSIVANASLIKKVYVPKYMYPLTRTFSSLVNMLISLIPLFFVAIISGIMPTKAYFLLPIGLVCIAVFSLGLGLVLCSFMVFFRDTQFLWGVLSMIWMYLTPIFYPADILPPGVDILLKINPLYYFITFVRTIVIEGVSPEPVVYAQCVLFALGSFIIGAIVFKKSQDKFVLHL